MCLMYLNSLIVNILLKCRCSLMYEIGNFIINIVGPESFENSEWLFHFVFEENNFVCGVTTSQWRNWTKLLTTFQESSYSRLQDKYLFLKKIASSKYKRPVLKRQINHMSILAISKHHKDSQTDINKSHPNSWLKLMDPLLWNIGLF